MCINNIGHTKYTNYFMNFNEFEKEKYKIKKNNIN